MWRYVVCLALLGAASLAAAEGWEYCNVVMPREGGEDTGRMEGRVTICVFTANGCRNEDVVVAEPAETGRYARAQAVRVQALANAKALARLGKEGWEMVSVMKREEWVQEFYFKRPVGKYLSPSA